MTAKDAYELTAKLGWIYCDDNGESKVAELIAEAVNAAIAQETEKCAKIANEVLNRESEFDSYRHGYRDAAMEIERRIRARANRT